MLIGAETMVSAGRDEGRVTFPKLQLLAVDVDRPASLEHDVDLVVGVYPLMVWLRRDERVDTDLKPPRFVDGLVATFGGAASRDDPCDLCPSGLPGSEMSARIDLSTRRSSW